MKVWGEEREEGGGREGLVVIQFPAVCLLYEVVGGRVVCDS